MCLRVLEILYYPGHLSCRPCVEWEEGRRHGHVLALDSLHALCRVRGFNKSDFGQGVVISVPPELSSRLMGYGLYSK